MHSSTEKYSVVVVTFLSASLSDVPVLVDISQYEIPEEPSKMSGGLIESELAGKSYSSSCLESNFFYSCSYIKIYHFIPASKYSNHFLN